VADRLEQLKKELSPGRFRSFEEIEASIFQFERVLRSNGIDIESGSQVESACLSGIHILMAKNGTAKVPPNTDIRPSFVDACGLWQFIERVNRLEGTQFLPQLAPHLHLLMEGDFAQNRKSGRQDYASNKLFKLLVGLSAADIGTNTELDHPAASTGLNPDVLTTIETRGPAFRVLETKRWAFACKTLHSDAPKTLYDRVEEGIDQIRRAPSADTGVVVINLKNIIDHESLFPIVNRADYDAGADQSLELSGMSRMPRLCSKSARSRWSMQWCRPSEGKRSRIRSLGQRQFQRLFSSDRARLGQQQRRGQFLHS